MAHEDRGAVPSVIRDLLERPTAYSFFQAVRLMRLAENKASGAGLHDFYHNELRVRPHLSLSFPANDMTEIGLRDDGDAARLHITATFMGLYGTGSPLPTFYTEELLDEASDDKSVCRDFLDIFNSSFYAHFFQAWTKYRLHIKAIDERDDSYLDKLFCLMGLGHEELKSRFPNPVRGLRFIGLFTQFPRSAIGLRTVLADLIEGGTVEVHQCQYRRVAIPQDQRCHLGLSGATLGQDVWLGQEMGDRMGKIRLEVKDMDEAAYHRFIPGSAGYTGLLKIVGYYLVAPLEFDVSFTIKPEEVRTARLGPVEGEKGNEDGRKWTSLGLDTWIYSGDRLDDATAVFAGPGACLDENFEPAMNPLCSNLSQRNAT